MLRRKKISEKGRLMSDILEVNYFLKIERLLITILTSGALNHFHECLVLFLLAA